MFCHLFGVKSWAPSISRQQPAQLVIARLYRAMAPTAPAVGPFGLVRVPRKGDKVQTWSTSKREWLEGTVEELLKEQFSSGALVMPRGGAEIQSCHIKIIVIRCN